MSRPDALPSATPRLVPLSADHPGFRDEAYRARRDAIARQALEHRPGDPPPAIDYTDAERGVWREVWGRLADLHEARVCPELRAAQARLALPQGRIPQLDEVNRELARAGFRFEPVAGLIEARAFLARLADGVFLSTQYVRHPSRPFYTPEPDVLHELIGHAGGLCDPLLAEVHRAFGRAARRADEARMLELERLYWFSVEYGLVASEQGPLAMGAGLMSSIGELSAFRDAELLPWNSATVLQTPYDPTDLQPRLYVASGFEALCFELLRTLGAC